MRIQNNITAMNTHRMYTMNNDAVAASAKKLSSGYRINSAADDAAGLAISEKMRSQIRGLKMATKNSQDAISLVQTAEGALQETQNMLQRMNELAVQAATGTNEDLDRAALSKEFEQLKREINDVAEQTNFNNMKILDGSLSYTGYVRSSATAGVTTTVEDASNLPSSKNPVSAVGEAVKGTGAQEAKEAAAGKATVTDVSFATTISQHASATSPQKTFTYDFGDIANAPITINAVEATGGSGSGTVGAAVADALNADAVFSNQFEASYADGKLSITSKDADGDGEPDAGATLGLSKLSVSVLEKNADTNATATTTAATPTITLSDDNSTETVAGIDVSAALGKGDATDGTNDDKKATSADQKYQLNMTYTLDDGDGGTKTVSGSTAVKTGTGGENIGDLFADSTVTFKAEDGTEIGTYKVTWDNATGKMGLVAMNGSTKLDPDGTNAVKDLKINVSGEGADPSGMIAKPKTNAVVTDNKDGNDDTPAVAATGGSQAWKIDFKKDVPADATVEEAADIEAYNDGAMKNGQTVTVDGKTYTYSDAADRTNAAGTTADLKADQFDSMDTLISRINGNPDRNVTASEDADGNLVLKQNVVATDTEKTVLDSTPDFSVKWDAPKGEGKKTTVEFDFAKLQDGDAVKITIGSKDVTVSKQAGDTRQGFMDRIQQTLDDEIKDDRVYVGGNALISEGVEVKVDMKLANDGLADAKHNALRIQVGALQDEQLSVAIDAMNTAGLNLDDSFLCKAGLSTDENQDLAGAAITATRNAINKISDQRATLGAMQNRLDHKIANLKTTTENLSASESRIRDVDMAEEMTNFTKNNILSQAATAMLAQANSLPQNVLSLLG